MTRKSYVDRQFFHSVALTIAFYSVLMTTLISVSWWLGNWAAIAFFAFLLWAYRWSIGEKLGLCARRPGARREANDADADAAACKPRS